MTVTFESARAAATITPAPFREALPLRYGQELRLLRAELIRARGGAPDSFNVVTTFRLIGTLDAVALERALNRLVQRHAVLRARITPNGTDSAARARQLEEFGRSGAWSGQLYTQEVVPAVDARLERRSLSAAGDDVVRAVAAAMADVVLVPVADLHPPLLRAILFRIDQHDHILTLTVPHLVADAHAMAVVERDLFAFYASETGILHAAPPPLRVSAVDHAYWERERIGRGELSTEMQYWLETWLRCRERLFRYSELPFGTSAARATGARGAGSEMIELNRDTSDRIRSVVRGLCVTPYVFFRVGVAIVLQQRTGKDGAPMWSNFANRRLADTQDMVGWLVNSHIVDSPCSIEGTGCDALAAAHTALRASMLCQEVPLQALWNTLGRRLYTGWSDVRIAMDYFKAARDRMVGDLRVQRLHLPDFGGPRRRIELTVVERNEGFALRVTYAIDLCSPAAMRRFLSDVKACLQRLAFEPERRVSVYCQ